MDIRGELEVIRLANPDQRLVAAEVVDFARDESSALHTHFEWDDSIAGQAYRLSQARAIIRVVVVYAPQADREIKAYVSVPSDRLLPGGGYTPIAEVLTTESLHEQMVEEALRAIRGWRAKYADLLELIAIFNVVDEVESTIRAHQLARRKRNPRQPDA